MTEATPGQPDPGQPDPGQPDPGQPDLARSSWGRVAANGDVFVRTPDGERQIGNWQAGSPDEGIAYYRRRYADLESRVLLLERRAGSGAARPAELRKEQRGLLNEVEGAAAIGDLPALTERLQALIPRLDRADAAEKEKRQAERERGLAEKREIIAEAQAILKRGNFARGTQEMSALLDRWKALPRADKTSDDALWKEFSATRTQFAKARKAFRAEEAARHQEATSAKERLIAEAEAMSGSTDWGETSRAYRDLMQRWKRAGSAGRRTDDELWKRFRAAQDVFFQAREAADSERDAEQQTNLAAKQALLERAEALVPVSDHAAAKQKLRSIQAEWESVGHVPRSAIRGVESRLRAVEREVEAAERAEWRRTDPETTRRASSTADQLRKAIADLEAALAAAEESGDKRRIEGARAALDARRSWLEQAESFLT